MNTKHEFAYRETHIVFGDKDVIAKILRDDPEYFNRHPRHRYGKTRYDRMPPAERAAAKKRIRGGA